MSMKLSEAGLIIYYSLLCCAIHGISNGQANAENVLEHNSESIPNEDTLQFHNQNHERRHLLAHLADRMDLDGEGLRHIQKHLGEVTGESEQSQDVKDVAAGDNAKGIFYFFKLHDYDDNQKLDGLEWMQALTDFHQEDNDKGEFKEGGRVFLEHEAEAIIDELLTKHDMDDDGMIDFLELMNSRVESIMTDLDKPVPGEEEVPEGDEQQQQKNDEDQSSLEQEFNQHQQGQQSSEQNQPQHENEPQDNQQQDQQEEHNQQESKSEEPQGDQKQQDNHQQNEPSLDDEYNHQQQQHQQHQQEDQQQEQNQQEHKSEETQDDQEQQENQQQNEPSLEEEYNQQHQQQQ